MPYTDISSGAVILIGISIVFTVLILIIGMIYLLSWVVRQTGKDKAERQAEPTPAVEIVPVSAGVDAPPQVDGVDDETVAVITAAVASVMGAGFRVRSITSRSHKTGSRSSWAQAGVLQNTTPF